MASNITPLDEFTSPVVVPDDGDAVNGTETLLTAQALADRTQFVFNRVPQAQTVTDFLVPLSSGMNTSITAVSPFDKPVWVYGMNTASPIGWLQNDISGTSQPQIGFDVGQFIPPAGSTLDSVTFHVEADGHGGSLPANLPELTLSRHGTDGVRTEIDAQIDTSASIGAYEANHTIALTSLSHTILANTQYRVELRGESGANSVTLVLLVTALELGWTP